MRCLPRCSHSSPYYNTRTANLGLTLTTLLVVHMQGQRDRFSESIYMHIDEMTCMSDRNRMGKHGHHFEVTTAVAITIAVTVTVTVTVADDTATPRRTRRRVGASATAAPTTPRAWCDTSYTWDVRDSSGMSDDSLSLRLGRRGAQASRGSPPMLQWPPLQGTRADAQSTALEGSGIPTPPGLSTHRRGRHRRITRHSAALSEAIEGAGAWEMGALLEMARAALPCRWSIAARRC